MKSFFWERSTSSDIKIIIKKNVGHIDASMEMERTNNSRECCFIANVSGWKEKEANICKFADMESVTFEFSSIQYE